MRAVDETHVDASNGHGPAAASPGSRFVRGPRWSAARARAAAAVPIKEGQSRRQTLVREGLQRRALVCGDVAAVALALVITSLAVGDWFRPLLVAALPGLVAANKAAGLYDRDELVLRKSTLEDVPALLQITGLLTLVLWLSTAARVRLGPADVLLLWGSAFGLMIAGRVAARAVARRLADADRCLVVGSPESIVMVAGKLEAGGVKAQVVATIELESIAPRVDVEDFRRLVALRRVDRVIVAPLETDPAELLELIRIAKAIGLRVSLIPRLLGVIGSAVMFDELDGLPILGVRRAGLERSARVLKRSFDLVGATLGIVVLAPLMLAIAIAIRVDSPGPVLFSQTRVGRDGKRFRILKFRSMIRDAEGLKPSMSHLNEAARGLFKIRSDPRLTRVGRLLRRGCLDELPQLFNVWRGDMSLVGPRPLIEAEDAMITGLDRSRLALKPGMTGHWQVLGSARIPIEEMVAIDYLYTANWSLWTDVKLLLRTLRVVISGAGI
jgi:exopolysaccharide biosynthesis polyprenyl glycosylphosphotransferase